MTTLRIAEFSDRMNYTSRKKCQQLIAQPSSLFVLPINMRRILQTVTLLSTTIHAFSISVGMQQKQMVQQTPPPLSIPRQLTTPPPIVYTIAGSDSGGGAGIQADLHAIHTLGCHGCTIITCLTAQSSIGVTSVHTPPIDFFKQQFYTVFNDMPPTAIKIGMLGTVEIAKTVGMLLKEIRDNEKLQQQQQNNRNKIWIVLDPVMVSTSGHCLIEEETKDAMIEFVFPYVDLITPNLYEVDELLKGRRRRRNKQHEQSDDEGADAAAATTNVTPLTVDTIPQAAQEMISLFGARAVLIKGGHDSSTVVATDDTELNGSKEKYVQDYLLVSSSPSLLTEKNNINTEKELRICDVGCWIRGIRYNNTNTHGTGCTLSSSIASILALGEHARRLKEQKQIMLLNNDNSIGIGGIWTSIDLASACVIAKAYVSAGIDCSTQLGSGPGPVSHTTFPNSYKYYPSIVADTTISKSSTRTTGSTIPTTTTTSRRIDCKLGTLLPIVDTIELVEQLCQQNNCYKENNINLPVYTESEEELPITITDIQLRIKDTKDPKQIKDRIIAASRVCYESNVRLWINDHWEVLVELIEQQQQQNHNESGKEITQQLFVSNNNNNNNNNNSNYKGGCYGIHIGQEDLYKCIQNNGLTRIQQAQLQWGISTHSFSELAVALGYNPSYISLGPIYETTSKNVQFDPQGIETIQLWKSLVPSHIPLCVIGGIRTKQLMEHVCTVGGADCVAVIGAVTDMLNTNNNDNTKSHIDEKKNDVVRRQLSKQTTTAIQ